MSVTVGVEIKSVNANSFLECSLAVKVYSVHHFILSFNRYQIVTCKILRAFQSVLKFLSGTSQTEFEKEYRSDKHGFSFGVFKRS